jgi:hypothetical protein
MDCEEDVVEFDGGAETWPEASLVLLLDLAVKTAWLSGTAAAAVAAAAAAAGTSAWLQGVEDYI